MGAGGQSGTGLATYIAMEAGPGPPSPPTYIAMLLHCIIKGKAKLTIKNTSKKCDRSNHQIKKTKKTKSRKQATGQTCDRSDHQNCQLDMIEASTQRKRQTMKNPRKAKQQRIRQINKRMSNKCTNKQLTGRTNSSWCFIVCENL